MIFAGHPSFPRSLLHAAPVQFYTFVRSCRVASIFGGEGCHITTHGTSELRPVQVESRCCIDEFAGLCMIAYVAAGHLIGGHGPVLHIFDHARNVVEGILAPFFGDEHRTELPIDHVHAAMRALGLAEIDLRFLLAAGEESDGKDKEEWKGSQE